MPDVRRRGRTFVLIRNWVPGLRLDSKVPTARIDQHVRCMASHRASMGRSHRTLIDHAVRRFRYRLGSTASQDTIGTLTGIPI